MKVNEVLVRATARSTMTTTGEKLLRSSVRDEIERRCHCRPVSTDKWALDTSLRRVYSIDDWRLEEMRAFDDGIVVAPLASSDLLLSLR